MGLLAATFSTSCVRSFPVSRMIHEETQRGEIRYTLFSPVNPAQHQLILAHGFLRSPQKLHYLAEALADQGIATACIDLKHSRLWDGNHLENARDMIALRQALGWKNVAYGGFSAGGLSALLAASEDPACSALLLLDPVDHASLGQQAAPGINIPALAILGKPSPGNAWRNSKKMLASMPQIQILELEQASHSDFETDSLVFVPCILNSQTAKIRKTQIHQKIIRLSEAFLRNYKE